MSNKSMDGTIQVECAPQQQTVLSPQLGNHDRHQSVGERLKTNDNHNEDIGGSGLDGSLMVQGDSVVLVNALFSWRDQEGLTWSLVLTVYLAFHTGT